jgi:hypothetical protein
MRGPLAFRKSFPGFRERSAAACLLEQPSETIKTEKGLNERRRIGRTRIITELTFFMNDITFDGNILRDFSEKCVGVLCECSSMKDCPFTLLSKMI